MLWMAVLGCEGRSTKPKAEVAKSLPQVDDWPEIDAAAAEAAIRPPQAANQPASADQKPQPIATENKPSEPILDQAGSARWLDAEAQLPIEYWEVQYFNAQRIGMTHYKIEEAGSNELKIRMETNMQFARGERPLRQSIVLETREKLGGKLERFTESLTSGAMVSQTTGTVSGTEMKLKSEGLEGNSQKQVDWPEGSWGPMGIHQMLLRKPMVAGESRKASVFLPQRHQLADVTLVAGKKESTTSPEGLLGDVLPIDVTMQLAESGIRVRMWADALGRVQKTIWPEGLNLSSFRISREAAGKLQSEDEIESYANAALIVESTFRDIPTAKQVTYLITSEKPDPHELFSQQSNQTVIPKPVYETEVTVLKLDWQSPAPPVAKQPAPSLKELSSSPLLPSDNPQIERLAKQWCQQATDPLEISKTLLAATFQHVRKLEFTPSIHPVQVVAQNLEGDCMEHAMLLAALLRNRQIASRIASGLRLQERDGQLKFVYHAWTEAWIDGRWVAMDATTGQLTSCAYLKFIDTSLSDPDPYQPVLSVLRSLKQLKVSGVMGS